MRELYDHNCIPPTLSAIVVYGISLGLLLFAIVSIVRARARARLAREEAASLADPAKALHEGETVLTGLVEYAADRDVAVRVEIEQIGTEWESSGTWSHRWTETARKVIVAPFYLKLADDTRVRIEPSGDIDVADDLDGKVLLSDTVRKLSAELVPGEQIHVRGWLERDGDALPDTTAGYRDVTWGWVLRPARGQMLLSSHVLGDGLRKRASFHRWWGGVAAVLFVTFQLMFASYYQRTLGQVEAATVLAKHLGTYEDSDGDKHASYEIDLRLADGTELTEYVSSDDWASLLVESKVAVRRNGSSWNLGPRPVIEFETLLFPSIFVLVFAIWYRVRRRSSRPWYRKRMVETRGGRLPGS